MRGTDSAACRRRDQGWGLMSEPGFCRDEGKPWGSTALSADERRALRQALAYVLRHGAGGLKPQAGRALADELRRVLSDVDDVTIGRVILQVAQYLSVLVQRRPSEVATVASDQLLMAALDLTGIELRDLEAG